MKYWMNCKNKLHPKSRKEQSNMSLILGTVTGLVIGGAYGLLSTPRTGKENREYLKQYTDNVKQESKDFKDKVDDVTSSVSNLQTELEMFKGPVANEFKRIIHQYQNDISPRLDRIQARQEQLNDSIDDVNI